MNNIQYESARSMETAPRDGTLVRLLVEFTEHNIEDTDGPSWTIGAITNDEEDAEWQFAGWCWCHDHFTEGKGTPVGWLPLLSNTRPLFENEDVEQLINMSKIRADMAVDFVQAMANEMRAHGIEYDSVNNKIRNIPAEAAEAKLKILENELERTKRRIGLI